MNCVNPNSPSAAGCASCVSWMESVSAPGAELQTLTQQADATAERASGSSGRILPRRSRAAYLRGQGDALKLILNGADPNQTARDLRYLVHLSRAQHAMIETLRADLAHWPRCSSKPLRKRRAN